MAGAAFGEVHVPTTKPKKTTDQKLLVLVPFWGLFGVLKTKGLLGPSRGGFYVKVRLSFDMFKQGNINGSFIFADQEKLLGLSLEHLNVLTVTCFGFVFFWW